jgi:hypothetical protein
MVLSVRLKTSSAGEAKQEMTFDITCNQNIPQQALQNLIVAKHGRNMVTISTRNKKFPTARPIGLLKSIDQCEQAVDTPAPYS